MDRDKETWMSHWLSIVAYVCGVRHGSEQMWVGLEGALILLNPDDHRHEKLFRATAPHFPKEVRRDFERLRAARVGQRRRMVGATLARLREMLQLKTDLLIDGAGI